jgi:hypothetical protein
MLLPALLLSCVVAVAAQRPTVVDIRTASSAARLAALTCSGLANRPLGAPAGVYLLLGPEDLSWLADIVNVTEPTLTPLDEFLSDCVHANLGRVVLFNATTQQRLVPNILTIAAVLDAVPLERLPTGATLVFDALAVMAGFSALDATRYVYEHHVNATSTMAKVNPGLDVHGHPFSPHPPLKDPPSWGLADYIVKERLFAFFLNNGCIPSSEEHALVSRMVSSNPWPKPIAVWGYDDTYPIAGDIFEAETDCILNATHNMGQVASDGFNNLAFFSRQPPIQSPLVQAPRPPHRKYNASQTYVTLLIGDGDNLNFLKGSRREWMLDRVQRCAAAPSSLTECFPLGWTMSPHTLYAAPDMYRWYLNQSLVTQRDWFVLPPSGHLYAYPGMMHPADQAAFIARTEEDCHVMNTSALVSWEWFGTWNESIDRFYPQYGVNSVVRGIFPVNVPYMIPVLPFGRTQQYMLLGEHRDVVLFRPREWRGAKGSGSQYRTAEQMAAELNGDERGSIVGIYTTSDGGMNLQLLYDTVKLLAPHVQIVAPEELASLAVQRGGDDDEPVSLRAS